MARGTLDLVLELAGGTRLDVVRAVVEETWGAPAQARVVVHGAEIDWQAALAKDASLALERDGERLRRFPLVLARATYIGETSGAPRHELVLMGPLWLASLQTTTRKFRDATTLAIVATVLDGLGLRHAARVTAAPKTRPWTVQYRETSLAFVERLLEDDGIAHGIDDDGTVVLSDDSRAAPSVPGPAVIELVEAGGALAHGAEGIHALRRGARVAPGTASVHDYDWKNPRLSLYRSASAPSDRDLEVYEFPAGYRTPAEGERVARVRLEEHRARARWVEGEAAVPGFAPGRAFRFAGGAGGRGGGDYVLVEVRHTVESRGSGGAAAAVYGASFTAIPKQVAFRPPRRTPVPRVAGCHTAMVRGPAGSEIHTDSHGRFKAQFHWDREATGTDADSRWIRMVQEPATSMTLARVGWEVGVAYVDGQPDRPVGVARQINGAMPPVYAQPAHRSVMAVRTPSSPATGGHNELRLEDTAGAMTFDLRAERDLVGIVKHDRNERIGNDEMHVVGQSLTHVVERDQTVSIGGDSTTTVNGALGLSVRRNRTVTVGGSERVAVSAGATRQVGADDAERVGSVRITAAGTVGPPSRAAVTAALVPKPKAMLHSAGTGAVAGALFGGGAAGAKAGAMGSLSSLRPSADQLVGLLTQGSIVRTAKKSVTRMVGGAFVSVAVQGIATSVQLGMAETVGGIKVTVAGADIVQNVGGLLVTTVGGAMVRSAMGDITRSSKTTRITVGGLATLSSTKGVKLAGARVVVEALAGLELTSGGVRMKLAPGGVELGGDVRVLSKGKVIVRGDKDDVTKA